MPVFRILHLSDFHICIEPNRKNWLQLLRERKYETLRGHQTELSYHLSSYRPVVAEAVARLARRRRINIDLIVCSGDLATTGQYLDLDSAKRYFCEDPRWQRPESIGTPPTLLGLGRPTLLMPGNHDRYQNGLGKSGGEYFDEAFKDHWPKGSRVHYKVVQKGNQKLAVIAADFCLKIDKHADGNPKKLKRLGQGKCYPEVLSELQKQTIELIKLHPGLVVIWSIHFPIKGKTGSNMKLIDAHKIENLAVELGIKIILSGHMHKVDCVEISGGLQLQAGTCCAVDFEGGHYVHEVDITIDGKSINKVSISDSKWNVDTKAFVNEGERTYQIG